MIYRKIEGWKGPETLLGMKISNEIGEMESSRDNEFVQTLFGAT